MAARNETYLITSSLWLATVPEPFWADCLSGACGLDTWVELEPRHINGETCVTWLGAMAMGKESPSKRIQNGCLFTFKQSTEKCLQTAGSVNTPAIVAWVSIDKKHG